MSLKFVTVRSDMSKHIEKISALIEQMQEKNEKVDETLAVGIILASIEFEELRHAVATIKKLLEENIKWESVT